MISATRSTISTAALIELISSGSTMFHTRGASLYQPVTMIVRTFGTTPLWFTPSSGSPSTAAAFSLTSLQTVTLTFGETDKAFIFTSAAGSCSAAFLANNQ